MHISFQFVSLMVLFALQKIYIVFCCVLYPVIVHSHIKNEEIFCVVIYRDPMINHIKQKKVGKPTHRMWSQLPKVYQVSFMTPGFWVTVGKASSPKLKKEFTHVSSTFMALFYINIWAICSRLRHTLWEIHSHFILFPNNYGAVPMPIPFVKKSIFTLLTWYSSTYFIIWLAFLSHFSMYSCHYYTILFFNL